MSQGLMEQSILFLKVAFSFVWYFYIILATMHSGVKMLVIGLKFTTYGTLNFFVSGPILKLFFSAKSLDPKDHVTKYSPLQRSTRMARLGQSSAY